MHILTLVTNPEVFPLTNAFIEEIQVLAGGREMNVLNYQSAVDIKGIHVTARLQDDLQAIFAPYPIDFCLQPEATRRKQLLISDMDSTVIEQECIDELADMIGIREQISEITERAMQGEIDFTTSLITRVALLKDLPETMLERVLQQRITFSYGADIVVRTMRANGACTMLVSGGFTFFTSRVTDVIGFDIHHANSLEIKEGKLTGEITAPILDQDSKRNLLMQTLKEKDIDVALSMAVGDGANDVEMIRAAGLGVAYKAKPYLQTQADASIINTDLTTLLYFQGYEKTQWL